MSIMDNMIGSLSGKAPAKENDHEQYTPIELANMEIQDRIQSRIDKQKSDAMNWLSER